jgi:GNAT superfamily N-acetyltransferase
MPTKLQVATPEDALGLVALHTAANDALTAKFGSGPWSGHSSEKAVRFHMTRSTIYILRRRAAIVATFALSRRKPWAIDRRYFDSGEHPLYLAGMAVTPKHQRRGLGAAVLAELPGIVKSWPADSVRLCAFAGPAGAGDFYRKCGFREVRQASYKGTPHVYFDKLFEL